MISMFKCFSPYNISSLIVLVFLLMPQMLLWAASSPEVSFQQTTEQVVMINDGLRLPVSLKCPVFVFDTGNVGGLQAPMQVSGDLAAGEEFIATYAPLPLSGAAKLEVKVHLSWNAGEGILRKWAEYRLHEAPSGCVLKEIQLELLDRVADQPIDLLLTEIPQSYPGFFKGFFAGIEFPVAYTRLENNRLLLAYKSGRAMQGDSAWHQSHRAIYGAAIVGNERETFDAYIAKHRPQPTELHFSFNSWWTTPYPYNEADALSLIQAYKTNLHLPYGVSPQSYTFDDGWTLAKSIWRINPVSFPQGFANIENAAQQMNAHQGIWISPSGCYSNALDQNWAQANGYETWMQNGARLCCLAGKKYSSLFRDSVLSMVKGGVRQIKFDGCLLQCTATDHGHQPGELASDAMVQSLLDIIKDLRTAAPDVLIEICFGNNVSPWWLFHINCVLGPRGDDYPWGRVPAPIFRESYTSARDFYNLQGASYLRLPINAQEVLGVVHQTDEPFLNDAVDVILRGHSFVSLYVNPKFMNARRWGELAALMKWTRANEPMLLHTAPLLPEAWQDGGAPKFTGEPDMPRQPYGYIHWSGNHGLILLRNPWLKKQTMRLDLAKQVGVPVGLKGLSAVSLYPEVRLYGKQLKARDVLEVPLAPYETLVLSLSSQQDLEGVVSAKKSFGNNLKQGKMNVDFQRAQGGDQPTSMSLTLAGQVKTKLPQTELLILLEGNSGTPQAGQAKLLVNGQEVSLAEIRSDKQWTSTGLPVPEYWTFLVGKLGMGANDIHLELKGDASIAAVSCWAWAYKNIDSNVPSYPNALPSPERLYLDSVPLFESQSVPIKVSGGGAGVLSKAIAEASSGDTIEIQDSLVYTETAMIANQWKHGMTICAKAGHNPQIHFDVANMAGGIVPAVSDVRIGSNAGGQITLRTKQPGIYCINASNLPIAGKLRIEHCRFTGADATGRNKWLGGGLFANNKSTVTIVNCDFYDMADDEPGRFSVCNAPSPDTGSTVNIQNCHFMMSMGGGKHQYLYHPSVGSTTNVDESTFTVVTQDFKGGMGKLNMTHSTVDVP